MVHSQLSGNWLLDMISSSGMMSSSSSPEGGGDLVGKRATFPSYAISVLEDTYPDCVMAFYELQACYTLETFLH
jgi:hypothetical protein